MRLLLGDATVWGCFKVRVASSQRRHGRACVEELAAARAKERIHAGS